MSKKAIITVNLVEEASEVSTNQIEEDIRKSLRCDWKAKIKKVEIEKSENCVIKDLKKKGLSKNVATNVVRFYRELPKHT